jgi:hypothetical protein
MVEDPTEKMPVFALAGLSFSSFCKEDTAYLYMTVGSVVDGASFRIL